jgi:4'-phosphopantetheinyl transferase
MVERSAEVLARWPDPLRVLTPTERVRAGRFRREQDASDFVAAHLLARECAGTQMQRPPAEIIVRQSCSGCGRTDHGAPFVAGASGVAVSLSHSRGVVAAAAVAGVVGVDVERRGRRRPAETLLASVLTADELAHLRTASGRSLAFLRLWVRKEALVKLGDAELDRLDERDVLDLGATTADGRRDWWVREHVDEEAVAAVVWRG